MICLAESPAKQIKQDISRQITNKMKTIFLCCAGLMLALAGNAQVAQTTNLTLEGAQKVIDAAIVYAKTNQSPGGSIAVVDAGGHLLMFERLDGSFPASATVAIEKARTAALFRAESKKLEDAINGGREALITVGYTFLQGGVPVIYNGQIVGAIGVSGAKSADQDREIATAGAEALLK
jgi:glc operon protein GlcG